MTDEPYGARTSTQNGRCWSIAQTPAAGGASSVSAGRPCPLGRLFPPVRPRLPRELRQGLTSTARRQGATRGGRPGDGDAVYCRQPRCRKPLGRSTCGSGVDADRQRSLSRPAARSDNGEDDWLVARSSLHIEWTTFSLVQLLHSSQAVKLKYIRYERAVPRQTQGKREGKQTSVRARGHTTAAKSLRLPRHVFCRPPPVPGLAHSRPSRQRCYLPARALHREQRRPLRASRRLGAGISGIFTPVAAAVACRPTTAAGGRRRL